MHSSSVGGGTRREYLAEGTSGYRSFGFEARRTAVVSERGQDLAEVRDFRIPSRRVAGGHVYARRAGNFARASGRVNAAAAARFPPLYRQRPAAVPLPSVEGQSMRYSAALVSQGPLMPGCC